jgi:hypothetical protein
MGDSNEISRKRGLEIFIFKTTYGGALGGLATGIITYLSSITTALHVCMVMAVLSFAITHFIENKTVFGLYGFIMLVDGATVGMIITILLMELLI